MNAALAGLLAVFGLAFSLWLLSLAKRDASIVDIFWGLGFAALAWLYHERTGAESFRAVLVPALVTLWGVRLAAHIGLRHRGEDPRYQAMRRKWGARFGAVSLFTVFWLQAAIMWIVAMPLLQAQLADAPWSRLDWLGTALFAGGFLVEATADLQLRRFRADPANRGRVMEGGLWRYSRHPNYFGDAVAWWGLGCLALATPGGAWTLFAPAIMTFLLLRVSGVPLLEKGLRASRPGYAEYARRTSAFVPWPPRPA